MTFNRFIHPKTSTMLKLSTRYFRLPSVPVLLGVATVSLLFDASFRGILFSTLLVACAIGLIGATSLEVSLNQLARWSRKTRLRRLALTSLPSLVLLVAYILTDLTLAPAQAQFLQNAETFITTLLAGSNVPATMVPLIFGVLRAIFVIYIAIAVIRVLVAARNDDDWTTLARTPLIIVMAIVIGDLMANLVIGGAAP
ncbi:MAG: hypothetical protein AAF821_19255 [Cyanobacteria bacterium P01_D01_bin.156]